MRQISSQIYENVSQKLLIRFWIREFFLYFDENEIYDEIS